MQFPWKTSAYGGKNISLGDGLITASVWYNAMTAKGKDEGKPYCYAINNGHRVAPFATLELAQAECERVLAGHMVKALRQCGLGPQSELVALAQPAAETPSANSAETPSSNSEVAPLDK